MSDSHFCPLNNLASSVAFFAVNVYLSTASCSQLACYAVTLRLLIKSNMAIYFSRVELFKTSKAIDMLPSLTSNSSAVYAIVKIDVDK